MTKMSARVDYVKETDTFIQRLLNGEFVFTAKATELKYAFDPQTTDTPMERLQKTRVLADCLNMAINWYEANKHFEQIKLYYAKLCYDYVKIAWLTGSVQESEGLTKKIEECRTENIQLRKKMEELSVKYLEASKKIEMFESKFPPLKKGK